MAARILIRQQRKRRNASGSMTGLAVLLKNSDDLIIERDVAAPGESGGCAKQNERK
jgi:hypothetical protein